MLLDFINSDYFQPFITWGFIAVFGAVLWLIHDKYREGEENESERR